MPASPGPAGLAGLIDREIHELQAFVALLRREQTLLGENGVDELSALAGVKSRLADTLTVLARSREGELAALGLPAGRAGMEAWGTSEAGRAGRAAWQRLLELATEARALNETNGRLIALRLRHNQQALGILMAAADQASTYGPDGQQRPPGGGRSLGSA